jgi:hypothetical protein
VEPNSHRSQVADGGDRYLLQWFNRVRQRYATTAVTLSFVLPLALITSFFCSVYIDSQNGGVIEVCPQKLNRIGSVASGAFIWRNKTGVWLFGGAKPGSRGRI